MYFYFYIFKQKQQIKRKGNETFNTVMILSTVDDLNAFNIEIGSKTLNHFLSLNCMLYLTMRLHSHTHRIKHNQNYKFYINNK